MCTLTVLFHTRTTSHRHWGDWVWFMSLSLKHKFGRRDKEVWFARLRNYCLQRYLSSPFEISKYPCLPEFLKQLCQLSLFRDSDCSGGRCKIGEELLWCV